MRKQVNIVAALTILAGLSGCASAIDGSDVNTSALATATAFHLSPGDRLKINVFNEPDLTGEFAIDENGNIAFPLLGEVRASGLAVDELKTNLVERLEGGFVRNPRINIDVLNYQPVNILGEVKNAGQYPYRPGMTSQDIAAIAGGYSYRANENVIYITRGANKKQITVDLDGGKVPILPGDSIRVPERYF